MTTSPLLASGDPVLFILLGGVLLLAGAAVGLGIAGIVLLRSKSEENRKKGRRFIISAAIPVIIAAVWWVTVVGFD